MSSVGAYSMQYALDNVAFVYFDVTNRLDFHEDICQNHSSKLYPSKISDHFIVKIILPVIGLMVTEISKTIHVSICFSYSFFFIKILSAFN